MLVVKLPCTRPGGGPHLVSNVSAWLSSDPAPMPSEAKTFRDLNLKFPDDIERDEVEIVRRIMSLQRSGERSAAITVGAGASVHQLARGAGRYVVIDLILDAGAISQLAIDRQDGVTVRFRYWRTVIGKSRGPQPFFTDPQLLPDRNLTRVREMQVSLNGPLVDRRDSYRELPERRPILPSGVTHQTEVGWDLVERTRHRLLRLCQRDIDSYSADSLANMAEN